jgi:hypothetical protein
VAPGFAGLYQINIQIPPDAPTGDYVPIVVEMNGQQDATTTLAIQPKPSGAALPGRRRASARRWRAAAHARSDPV